jgi:hypothetical protein
METKMTDVLDRPIAAESRLRQRNQITVPETIVRALDAEPDDTLVWEADPAQPGVVRVQVLPRTFAASMTGVFGTTEQVLDFVRGERAAWGE